MIFTTTNDTYIKEDKVDDVIKANNKGSTSSEDVKFGMKPLKIKPDDDTDQDNKDKDDDTDFSMDGMDDDTTGDDDQSDGDTGDDDQSDGDTTGDDQSGDGNGEDDDTDFSMDDDSTDDPSSDQDTSSSSDTGTGDDSLDDAESGESELVQKEKDLFKDLTDEQIKIKKYELISSINNLYEACDDALYRLNNTIKTTITMRTIEFITKKLNELRDNISFYITNTFSTKAYIENYIYYQNCLVIFNDISKILNEIAPKPGKNNSK